MQKFMKKICALILSVAMIGSMLPQVVSAAETEYQIYPTPQEMTYEAGSFELKDLNVIYGNGMDEATKARFNETAELLNLEVSESTTADAEKTNVYVGIYGSDDAAADYITSNYTVDATLFGKADANFVATNNGEIVVLGKDVDSCFYGITTLYHVFTQVTDGTVRNFTVEDYADVVSRGFIEGYYGNPWSTEDRCNLMEWGGYYKLNSYFYAPKDDPKHNAKWKELYTEEEIETKIKPLAEAGNASKCRFVYALHPYMHNAIRHGNEAGYQEDMATMQAKFEQVIEAGVRQIAILADDAANVGGNNYIRMLTDMTAWIKEKQETYPDLKLTLPFCTQEYMYGGEGYYANFPENVQIVMTGGRIWGEVSEEFTSSFTNNVGRGPYLWINWPCTDNSKNHLIMGGYTTFLHPGVDPSKIQGIVLNPMQQSEPSKVAIFGNACYSWNIWETAEEADAAWEASFSYVDHNDAIPNEASNALKELSKHMMNQNMDSRVTPLQESVELKEILNDFKAKLDANTVTDDDIDAVIDEFEVLKDAAATYREKAGDTNVRDQIVYWLNCWDDTTTAVISYLQAIKALNNNAEDAVIWENYATGQEAFENSKSHGFWYLDHTEYAEVGVQHIVPFMNKLGQYLSTKVATIVDPSKVVITYITNRSDSPATGSVNNIMDGNDSTNAIYKTPNKIVAGDYVGLMYNQVTDIDNIHFVLGAGKDHFDQGKLEYTLDGENWQDIELVNMTNNFVGTQGVAQVVDVAEENLPEDFKAMGIRFIATVDNAADAWLEVREVAVNVEVAEETESINYNVIKSSDWTAYQTYVDANLYDGSDSSFAWYDTGATDAAVVDAYVGYDFGEAITLAGVHLVVGNGDGDKLTNYALETSLDGSTWTAIEGYENYTGVSSGKDILDIELNNLSARYIRVRNLQQVNKWVKFSEFTVALPNSGSEGDCENVYTNTTLELKSIYEEALTSMVPVSGITLAAGEYVGLDLGRIKDLSEIKVEGQTGLTLQVSKNEVDWVTVQAGGVEEDARYIRLLNETDAVITTDVTKFEVASNEVYSPVLFETTMGINASWGVGEDCRENGAAFDGDVSTMTEFGDLPQQGQYIIYDLGQSRDIYKLEIYCQDSAVNYIRDAKMAVSNDLENWTDVLTIGDGVENTDDANITCINSGAGYSQTTSAYPNIVSIEGTIETTEARYIRILMTATNNNRAVVFTEIEINEGEYVSVTNDPTFEASAIEVQGHVPQNMIDGDLTTSYKPNTTEAGSVIYTFSDNLEANRINVVQKGNSGAKVYLYAEQDGERDWVEAGTLNTSLVTIKADYDLNLAMKIVWEEGNIPNITEIVRFETAESKEALEEALEAAGAYTEADKYTSTTWAAFQTALKAANEVNADEDATQVEVDAAAIALQKAMDALEEVTTPEPEQPKAGWVKDATGWWYRNADGTWPANSWKQIGGEWYWFGADGYMKTGWLYSQGSWYYLGTSGAMATGWIQVGSTWYYLNASGAMVTGWLQQGTTWYYLKADGSMATGWTQVGSTWYYLNASGAMATGWIQVGSTWYYLNGSGAMVTGWLQQGSTWYYLKSDGSMAVGKLKIGNRMNSFASSGVWLGYI